MRRQVDWSKRADCVRARHAVEPTWADEAVAEILLDAEADPSERPDGEWWGANAWTANERDRRLYGEEDL